MTNHFGARNIWAKTLLVAAIGAAISAPAHAQQTLLDDEFNGTSVSSSTWGLYGGGPPEASSRTEFGDKPFIATDSDGTSYARLPLSTYNPDPTYGATNMLGTQMYTTQSFNLGTGIQFEVRLRGENLPKGIVLGLFPFAQSSPSSAYEIDDELLTNQLPDGIWTNIWNMYDSKDVYNDGFHNQDGNPTATGANWATWTDFIIKWYVDRTEWYVNGNLIRTESGVTPTGPMALHLNIWAASTGWSNAYNAAIQSATSAASGSTYYMDVDYVKVTTIPLPTAATPASVGTGTGLSASYYNGTTLTGSAATQIDPRIDFNWGAVTPGPSITSNTNFSASWSGQIQAEYSETYTFYTQSVGGIRLFVNGQELVNNWTNHAATQNSGTINLVAGQKYPITVQYFGGTTATLAELRWSSPTTLKQFAPGSTESSEVVPQTQLYPTDSVVPTVAIVVPVANFSYGSLANVTGTATAGSSGVQSVKVALKRVSDGDYWNGSAFTPTVTQLPATGTTSWSWPFPVVATGQYSVQATVTNGAASQATSSAVVFYFDTTPPVPVISTPESNFTYKSLAQATGTASDVGAGVASVAVKLERLSDDTYWNGSAWAATATSLPAVGTSAWTYTLPALADGQYSIQATATDFTPNTGSSAAVPFWIANTAPTVTITAPGNTLSYKSLAQAAGTAADSLDGVAGVTVKLQRLSDNTYWNGSAWTTTATALPAVGANAWTYTLPALADGEYSIQATASDFAANTGVSAAVSFFIANGGPTVTVTTPGNDYSYKSLAQVGGAAADSDGVASVAVKLQRLSDKTYWNGSAWSATAISLPAVGTTAWTYKLPTLADGQYSIQAIATDPAANTGSSAAVPFWIANAAPTVSVTTPALNATYTSLAQASGSSADSLDGVASVAVKLQRLSDKTYWNGSAWTTTVVSLAATGTNSWTYKLPALAGGEYSIQASASDFVANTGSSTVVTFWIGSGAPTITSFTPASGVVGTTVTISGTNLINAATSKPTVSFGTVAAVVSAATATSVTVKVPTGAGTNKINLTTSAGAASSASVFTVPGAPTITTFAPASGAVGGSVVITGTNLINAATAKPSVKFGTVAAVVTVATATSVTVTVPAGAATNKINLTTSNGTVASANSFIVVVKPAIVSINPTSGSVGSIVTIAGSNLTNATTTKPTVTFGTVVATVSAATATSVTVTVPAGAVANKINVTTTGGTASSVYTFTVVPKPTITVFSPLSGAVGGSVVITGTGLINATTTKPGVTFGTVAAAVTAMTATSVTVTIPATAATNKINITTTGGTVASAVNFTVVPKPTVTVFAPLSGPVGGSVTITGSGLVNATTAKPSVLFGTVAATVISASATSAVVTVPAGAVTGKITVATSGGSVISAGTFTVTVAAELAASPSSSLVLSAVTASAASDTIALTFNGALNADSASEVTHYAVAVNGTVVTVESAGYKAGIITLGFAPGTLRSGATVAVAWRGLEDSAGRTIASSSVPVPVH